MPFVVTNVRKPDPAIFQLAAARAETSLDPEAGLHFPAARHRGIYRTFPDT